MPAKRKVPDVRQAASKRPQERKQPARPAKAPARPIVNRPAPRPVVNRPAPRPVPGGKLKAGPATVPLQQLPPLSAEAVQTLQALGVAQPGSTEGLPSHEVADAGLVDLLSGQVQVDVSARSEVRALSVKGAIFRAFNAIYDRGGATVHSGRAIQHVNQHIHGYRI